MNLSDRTINALQHRTQAFRQSENSVLPYTWNYASVLGTDTISTSTWSSQSNGVTIASQTNTTTSATAKLSGTAGQYKVVNKIVTAAGLTDERIINLCIQANDDSTTEEDYP